MNTDRRKMDSQGRMFIPMNVEGGGYDNKFLNSKKMVCIISMAVADVVLYLSLTDATISSAGKLIIWLIVVVASIYLIRYVVFEEKYFYKMYKKMKANKNPKPDVFWHIASVRETSRGTISIFSDLKIGVLVKLDKDSIIGRDDQFEEAHFDAISDFYKEVNLRKYSFVQINFMEQAGKDPRLAKLDDLVAGIENENIAKLIELQLGYIKNITRATLYESDYILIYTGDINRMDTILDDVEDIMDKILEGAYMGYDILNLNDMVELFKEQMGVSYFDAAEAAVNTFKNSNFQIKKAIQLVDITLENGVTIKLDDRAIYNIKRLASCISDGSIKDGEWTIRETIDGSIFRNKHNSSPRGNWGVDIDKLAKTVYTDSKSSEEPEIDPESFEESIVEEDDKIIDF